MNIVPHAIDEEIPAQRLNRVSEPMLPRENLALLPSLEPILEVEEEENDESRRGVVMGSSMLMTSRHNWQLGPRQPQKKRRETWFCCQCGDGPNEAHYVLSCLECYHPRCDSCTVATTKA